MSADNCIIWTKLIREINYASTSEQNSGVLITHKLKSRSTVILQYVDRTKSRNTT